MSRSPTQKPTRCDPSDMMLATHVHSRQPQILSSFPQGVCGEQRCQMQQKDPVARETHIVQCQYPGGYHFELLIMQSPLSDPLGRRTECAHTVHSVLWSLRRLDTTFPSSFAIKGRLETGLKFVSSSGSAVGFFTTDVVWFSYFYYSDNAIS